MRADRLIAELMLLQVHGKLSAAVLAREMEVSQRTIYRDMLALNSAGIPVYAENGTNGGYQLVDGYRTQLTGLSTGELQALFAMNIPSILGELGMDTEARNALRKLQASLSQQQNLESGFMAQRFLYDPTHREASTQASGDRGIMEKLQQAIWHDREVEIQIQYFYRPGTIILTIAPYALVLKENRWYLVYQRNQSFRVLSMAEITIVRELSQSFERETSFDLSAVWSNWTQYQQNQTRHYPVSLLVKATAFAGFANTLQANILQTTPAVDGWQEAECVFDRLEDARQKLLPLGGAIRILTPDPLRISMVDFAMQFLAENKT